MRSSGDELQFADSDSAFRDAVQTVAEEKSWEAWRSGCSTRVARSYGNGLSPGKAVTLRMRLTSIIDVSSGLESSCVVATVVPR